MTDLASFQAISEFWSAALCFITAIILLATMRFDKKRAWPIFGMLITNAVLNVAEALAYLFRGGESQVAFVIVRVANFTVFLHNLFLFFFVFHFIATVIKENGGPNCRSERIIVYFLLAASIVLLILSRPFRFYYDFDATNHYFRLDNYWVMIALNESIALVIIFMTLRNWKYLHFLERLEFLMLELLPIGAMVVQLFYYGISLTTLVNTISILMIFMTYEFGYTDHVVKRERIFLNQMIASFATAIDARDIYTGGHSTRVAKYSKMIAERLGLAKEQVEEIEQMALLHDIGKLAIPDAILNKAGRLTPEEYEVIKTHPSKGKEILDKIIERPRLAIGAKWHHERFDGKGYPDGLLANKIPLEARIIGMADAYDAMSSNRSYRALLTQAQIRAEIERNSGTQFDPTIAHIMLNIIDEDKDYQLHE